MPVFNITLTRRPILVKFHFNVFRVPTKHKVFLEARLAPKQKTAYISHYVVPTAHLILELTEKLAYKYLMMSNNDFGKMIEDMVIVMNSQLRIENLNFQMYRVQEVMKHGEST